MENDPLTFSLALCMRTRPEFLTATMMTRGFFESGFELGGGGAEGYAASSAILMCVMYDSSTEDREFVSLKAFLRDDRTYVSWDGLSLTGAIRIRPPKATFNYPPLLILKSLCPAHSTATIDRIVDRIECSLSWPIAIHLTGPTRRSWRLLADGVAACGIYVFRGSLDERHDISVDVNQAIAI